MTLEQPLRYRPPLGDRDIRDIRGPAPGAEIDMPDLPACLDRRSPARRV